MRPSRACKFVIYSCPRTSTLGSISSFYLLYTKKKYWRKLIVTFLYRIYQFVIIKLLLQRLYYGSRFYYKIPAIEIVKSDLYFSYALNTMYVGLYSTRCASIVWRWEGLQPFKWQQGSSALLNHPSSYRTLPQSSPKPPLVPFVLHLKSHCSDLHDRVSSIIHIFLHNFFQISLR